MHDFLGWNRTLFNHKAKKAAFLPSIHIEDGSVALPSKAFESLVTYKCFLVVTLHSKMKKD